MRHFFLPRPAPGQLSIPVILTTALVTLLLAVACRVSSCQIRVLLIGSLARGADHSFTKQSYLIENLLEFNGIPYDFFDIYANNLEQSTLDQYEAVILEGCSMRWDTTIPERTLIAQNMQDGSITALVGHINGLHDELNSTIYGAIGVTVDGLGNHEGNVWLDSSAVNIYDFEGDEGFIICGGCDCRHVGVTVTALGEWSYVGTSCCGERVYGLEVALERWMKNAFGLDARVAMPTVSLYLSDTHTFGRPRSQELIDFIAANKHRIRSSGFLVTDVSSYQVPDAITGQSDETILSEWGSMVLHGKDHGTVGAEGEDRDFDT